MLVGAGGHCHRERRAQGNDLRVVYFGARRASGLDARSGRAYQRVGVVVSTPLADRIREPGVADWRLLAGHSWRRLLADYAVWRGRVWPLFLAWIFVLPYLLYRFG